MARLAISADQSGTIVKVQGDVEVVLGWKPDDLVGQPIVEIIPFKYRERHAAGWDRWINTGEKRVMGEWLELEARRKDGNTISVTFCVTSHPEFLEAILETPADPELPHLDE